MSRYFWLFAYLCNIRFGIMFYYQGGLLQWWGMISFLNGSFGIFFMLIELIIHLKQND